MDPAKVDLILKYALARAAHEDSRFARELGPIHLLKYVYLADLAYAESHGGTTYTETQWQFYHYGPWSPPVMDRIPAVVDAIHANESVFESTRYENDRLRWFIDLDDAEEIQDDAERILPSAVTSVIRAAVHRYGSDTSSLLHHVYATAPMLHAAPNEILDFSTARRPPPLSKGEASPPLSRKQEKRREGALLDLRTRARERLAALKAERKETKLARPPRYDEVFAEGQKWLDDSAGGEVRDVEGEGEFDDEIWKSPWRSDPGH